MDGFKKIVKMKTGGFVSNVYEAKKSSGDKDNIQKTKAIKAGPAEAPSKAAVKSKDFGAKTVGASGHKDPYIKSKESGKTPDAPSAAVKGRNKKDTGTVNKFKTGGGVKKYSGSDGSFVGGRMSATDQKLAQLLKQQQMEKMMRARTLSPTQQGQLISQSPAAAGLTPPPAPVARPALPVQAPGGVSPAGPVPTQKRGGKVGKAK